MDQLIVGDETSAALNLADGLALYLYSAGLHTSREIALGKPLRNPRLPDSFARYILRSVVVINFQGVTLRFALTVPFFSDILVIKIYKIY